MKLQRRRTAVPHTLPTVIARNVTVAKAAAIAALMGAMALGASGRAVGGERTFGAVSLQPMHSTSHANESLKSAELLSRNYGAVQNPPQFRNANGDFSYLALYSSYGGYGGFYPWGGYYGYSGYGRYFPWSYGYRYAYPYRYYPYAYGYPYGFSYYGPTAYYGGWYGYGFPYSAAYYGPWWTGFGGGPSWYGGGPYSCYAGCYYW
jgi:hypothetical protein